MRVATSGMKPVFRPLTRVGCTRRLARGVPDEWPSRRRKSPNRTRLTGQLTLLFCAFRLPSGEPVGANRKEPALSCYLALEAYDLMPRIAI